MYTHTIEQNINESDWDNLIILDACRYDFFKNIYRKYLKGSLEKKISKGSHTGEWLMNTFPDKYDYTYVSANPYINSYSIPINKLNINFIKYNWKATDHFSKIIDVWEFGWDNEINTIHPKKVNNAYLNNKSNKKTIIHYMQPHYPYLSYIKNNHNAYMLNKIKEIYYKYNFNNSLKLQRSALFRNVIGILFERERKKNQIETLSKEIGIEKLYIHYEDNIKIVLQYVSQLLEKLSGKTIITSDHGEAFGEQGIWGHPMQTPISVLTEVPWLEILND